MAFKTKEKIDKDNTIFREWWNDRCSFLRNPILRWSTEVAQLCFNAGRKVEREILIEKIETILETDNPYDRVYKILEEIQK